MIAIPQKLESLVGFDLDPTERRLFGSFRNSAYYTCLLRGTGLPDNTTFTNFAGQTPSHLPPLPGLHNIMPTVVPGLFDVKYDSPFALPLQGRRNTFCAGAAFNTQDSSLLWRFTEGVVQRISE